MVSQHPDTLAATQQMWGAYKSLICCALSHCVGGLLQQQACGQPHSTQWGKHFTRRGSDFGLNASTRYGKMGNMN